MDKEASVATVQRSGRTIEKELFIGAAPERVFRAFTDKCELERWFVTKADVDLKPGGVFNLTWEQEFVAGQVVDVDPPRRFAFTWDDGPQYGSVTTCVVEFLPESDGTLLRLTHTGFGHGDVWDALFEDVNGGWTVELQNLRRWLVQGAPKGW